MSEERSMPDEGKGSEGEAMSGAEEREERAAGTGGGPRADPCTRPGGLGREPISRGSTAMHAFTPRFCFVQDRHRRHDWWAGSISKPIPFWCPGIPLAARATSRRQRCALCGHGVTYR